MIIGLKKLAAFLAALLFVTLMMPVSLASAAPEFNTDSIKCKSAILIDAKTGKMLVGKNETDQIFPASTTKIMSAILAVEAGDLDRQVTCGSEVKGFSAGASLMGLVPGEKITIRELLYGMMLVSGNDAANTVAIAVSGSIDAFVEKMNAKAQELKMTGTHFVNVHGVHKDDHYSTAADMARLAQYAMQNETFRKFVDTRAHTVAATNKHGSHQIENTNKLLSAAGSSDEKYRYAYAMGVKTGSTPKAGGCLVAAASHNGMELIACIFGDPTSDSSGRWGIARKLFDFGFNNYASVDLASVISGITIQERIPNAPNSDIGNGMLDLIPQLDGADTNYVDSKENVEKVNAGSGSITYTTVYDRNLVAPIAKDEKLGTVTYKLDDQVLLMVPLLASRDVLDADSVPGGSPTSAPASPGDPGYEPAKEKKDTSIVAIVIIGAVLLVGIVLLVNYLVKRRKKNVQFKRRVKNDRKSYYNYRRRF
jgi:serine-type D-Ala-D-Ala carboxypeptidase (penicillin-binding protein 5/6)